MHPYSYALKVGAKELVRGDFNHSIRHLLVPVPYWRLVEFRLVRDAGNFQQTDRILDIGSPKLLSIYLAKTLGANVYATDIDDYFVPEYTRLRSMEKLPPDKFHVEVEDGCHLTYQNDFFSKVFSVSVLEHIPGDGDSECAREIGRVLAPGGRCMLTVPFSRTSRNIYKKANQIYWVKSGENGGGEPTFFQRRYSESDLYDRLIRPSGLRLKQLLFVGERVLQHSSKEIFEYLPFYGMVLTGLAHPVVSRLFHTPPTPRWQDLAKPLCAFVVLEKPE
ncbi:MAG TPA: methyltransferase domain-containing protein [Ktedonobacterales bacterium]|nr:methyltransferase domain-containing protein [Ktedonobacterales bacterium]